MTVQMMRVLGRAIVLGLVAGLVAALLGGAASWFVARSATGQDDTGHAAFTEQDNAHAWMVGGAWFFGLLLFFVVAIGDFIDHRPSRQYRPHSYR